MYPLSRVPFCLPKSPRRDADTIIQKSSLCLRLRPELGPHTRLRSRELQSQTAATGRSCIRVGRGGGWRVRAGVPLRSGWALAHPGSPPKCLCHCWIWRECRRSSVCLCVQPRCAWTRAQTHVCSRVSGHVHMYMCVHTKPMCVGMHRTLMLGHGHVCT